MQQTDVNWDAIPDAIVSWLKLNLMQKMQAELYCLPWKVSELEWFPELKQSKRDRIINSFEYFINNVMGRVAPTKHQARAKLRETYREAVRGPEAKDDPELSPGLDEDGAKQRQLRSESPVERDTVQEPVSDLGGTLTSTFARTLQTETLQRAVNPLVQVPIFTQSPYRKLVNPEKLKIMQQVPSALPRTLVTELQLTLDGKSWRDQFPKTDSTADKVPPAAEIRMEADILGFPLPDEVFDASTDQDPYQLSAAVKEVIRLPAGARKLFGDACIVDEEVTEEINESIDIKDELELHGIRRSQYDRSGHAGATSHQSQGFTTQTSAGTNSPRSEKQLHCLRLVKLLDTIIWRHREEIFSRLRSATALPSVSGQGAIEYTRGLSGEVRPPENRNPWRGGYPKKRGHERLTRMQPSASESEEYVGCVSWSYSPPQLVTEPEPEAPIIQQASPPREPWTQKRAEDLLRSLTDPRNHVANLIQEPVPHGRGIRLGFQPVHRGHGAKPEDPETLKMNSHFGTGSVEPVPPPSFGKAPPAPSDDFQTSPISLRSNGGTRHSMPRSLADCPPNWMPVKSPQSQAAGEALLPQIGSPPKDAKRNGASLKTPREGPKFGGTG